MATEENTSTGVQPKQRWRRCARRQKIGSGEARAAPQGAEEPRDSSAGPGARAAAAESRAAAPHGPRARGRALLRSLRRGSRAILSRVAAVIPGTRRQRHRGTGSGTAAAAPAAGAGSRAAAPHGPCTAPGPSPGPLEAVGGQGAGAELGAVLTAAEHGDKGWVVLEEDLEVESLKELSQGEDDPEEGCSGEQRPPVRPRQAWVVHGNLPSCTATGQAPPLPSTAPHRWPELSRCKTILGYLPPSPSLGQVEARRQGARAAARVLLPGQVSEEGDTSEDVTASSRDESAQVSCNDEPRHLEPCKGTELLQLSPQTGDQSAAKGEARIKEEFSEKRRVFIPRTIWVIPRWWYAIRVHPNSPLEGEADAHLPSTSGALAVPRDTRPAAAAVPGTRAPAAERRAAAPHGPRACSRALLCSLRRGCQAVLSRVAAVIWRRSQQLGTRRHWHQGTEAGTAVRAPTEHRDQSWGMAEQRPPMRPREPWV